VLFEADPVRFLLAPRAYRCFDVIGVDPTTDRRDALVLLAGDFLDRHHPAVASVNVLSADPDTTWARVRTDADGGWSFQSGRAPEVTVDGLVPDDALGRLYDELDLLMPAAVPNAA
jgi:hypothetical protein